MKPRGLIIFCSLTVSMASAAVENQKQTCMDMVKYFIRKTTVYPLGGLPTTIYCESVTNDSSSIDMNDVIDFYKSLPRVKSESIAYTRSPVTEFGVVELNGGDVLPLYLMADIRSHHLNPLNNILPNNLNAILDRQMHFLGKLPSDEIGQLLPISVGGSHLLWNTFPISKQNLRQLAAATFTETPKTHWQTIINWIKSFLVDHYVNGRVHWRIVLHYYDETLIHPQNFNTYRPIGFTLQFTTFKDQYNTTEVFFRSPELTFMNNDNKFCEYDMNVINGSLYDIDFKTVCLKSEPYGLLETQSRRENPIICTIYELSLGPVNSCDRDIETYTFAFLFNFTKTYFFAYKIENTRWFIREILSDGQLGYRTDQGFNSRKIYKIFPFSIDDRQYFFDLDDSGKYTITELMVGGKMGQKTDGGDLYCNFDVALPIEYNNKKYVYLQCGQKYFFKELIPGGTLSNSNITSGSWQEPYVNALPFNFKDKLIFYFQHNDNMTWDMREVTSSSFNFGSARQHDQWDEPFEQIVRYQIEDYNLLILHSEDNYDLTIKHFNLKGYMKLRDNTSSTEHLKRYYHILIPYGMDNEHYLLAHEKENSTWMIREIEATKITYEPHKLTSTTEEAEEV